MEEQAEQLPQGIPQNSEPPLPENKNHTAETAKPESLLSYFFKKTEVGKYIIAVVIAFVVGLSGYGIYWIVSGKKTDDIKNTESIVVELKECSMGNMDEITGEIQLNGKIKRGGEITLVVHNKIKNSWEMALINEAADNRDGTFKFHFCKAVTDFVRFDLKILGNDTIPREYAVDEIPKVIPL